jgi:lysophospholipase L1-like esterase
VERTYPRLVAAKLAESHHVEYYNMAVSGATTTDVIAEQLEQIVSHNPNVVTISIGANDSTHLVAPKIIVSNYKKIIQELSSRTRAQIYLTNVPNFRGATLLPPPYICLLEYRSQAVNSRLASLETDRVKIVNIHDFGWESFPDRRITYSADHFHPNDMGYENWAAAFIERMKQLLWL